MKRKKYDKLREQYPEYISLDQFRCICKIAKRSASYLIQHGIIPAIDTGKLTWRYKIALDDVITYLRRREQWGSMIPPGALNAKRKKSTKRCGSFRSVIGQNEYSIIADYFSFMCTGYPDVLTVNDVSTLTGLVHETILRFIRDGGIDTLQVNRKYLIPKPYLLEFVQTPRLIDVKSYSETFIKVVEGFEAWQRQTEIPPT
jgi:hypothetical protein